MARLLIPTLLTASLLCGGALAQEPNKEDPSELAREGIERFMRALELFVDQIPLYGVPYVDGDGNVVIPRIDRDKADEGDDRPMPEEKKNEGKVEETRL
ncbi:hypothetical protein [Oceanibacterium hippocampi]|uniref:Uncharacterized protein n=1 Tax=Oceanibacterium hippocampi TaxID=745714 RepID=A0A1Y5S907_9PROT|nr:hypothetical protein [Oceanibacterium hippocampi]SLN34912.1 hypothetical protein OCH7691_01372 [Oceanibacterium hippocampi]